MTRKLILAAIAAAIALASPSCANPRKARFYRLSPDGKWGEPVEIRVMHGLAMKDGDKEKIPTDGFDVTLQNDARLSLSLIYEAGSILTRSGTEWWSEEDATPSSESFDPDNPKEGRWFPKYAVVFSPGNAKTITFHAAQTDGNWMIAAQPAQILPDGTIDPADIPTAIPDSCIGVMEKPLAEDLRMGNARVAAKGNSIMTEKEGGAFVWLNENGDVVDLSETFTASMNLYLKYTKKHHEVTFLAATKSGEWKEFAAAVAKETGDKIASGDIPGVSELNSLADTMSIIGTTKATLEADLTTALTAGTSIVADYVGNALNWTDETGADVTDLSTKAYSGDESAYVKYTVAP